MDRARIRQELADRHSAFATHVLAFPTAERTVAPAGKWTPVQHLDHIRMGVGAVAQAFRLPAWLLRWRFGKPNRPPRNYDGLVKRYRERLAAGGRSTSRFVPATIEGAEAERIAKEIHREVALLQRRMDGWSDAKLDTVLMPHPLLGKLTLREMLYFTVHHVQHHHELVDRDRQALR